MKKKSVVKKKRMSVYVLALTVPIGALYLLESFIFKAIEIREIEGDLALLSALRATAPDAAFAILLAVLTAWILSRGWRRVGLAATVLFYLVMVFSLFVSAFSHGYFLATGSGLSWSTIEYWLQNMSISNEIIAREAVSWKLFLLAAQLLLALICILLPRLKRIRAWFLGKEILTLRQEGLTVAAAAAATVILLVIPPPAGRAMSVAHCVPVSIAAGCIQENLLLSGDVEISKEDRLDGALKFEEKRGGPRPNIVFIIFESLTWKISDVHMPGMNTTPFLAELAREGTVIDRPYTVVPHTTKAIMPFLCGIYPYMEMKYLETTQGILPRRCLAHILSDIGYRTAFFQPAYNFENRNQLVANMGFELFKGLKDMPRKGFESISYFGAEDKMMLKPSMEWVDSVKDGPFFLTYMTLSTHHNYMTPQSFSYVKYPVEDRDQANYMNAARYVDDFIREVFEELEKRGLVENTVFLIGGDHGEAFKEHGRRQHDLIMWEEGLRTTALLYGPKYIKKGKKIEGVRSILDYVPTICDILKLDLIEGQFVGKSLFEPVPDDRKLLHGCWFNNECLAIHEGPIKTIYHYGSQPMEVYDDFKDPFEKDNLAHQGGYNDDFLEEKKQEMLHWKKVIDQQYGEWNDALSENKVTEEEPKVANRLSAKFGDSIEIVGFDAPKTAMAGQDVRIKYVFKCLEKMSSGDRLFVHIIHRDGTVNADHVPVNETLPLNKWEPGHYIVDEHSIHVPGTWSSGAMRVYLGFWNKNTRSRFPVRGAAGETEGTRLLVAQISVRGGGEEAQVSADEVRDKIKSWTGLTEPSYEKRMNIVFGETIELVGVTLDRVDTMLAGTVEMTYVFRTLKTVGDNWQLTVKLVREDGVTIRGDHVPIGGLYPPSEWREGEYVVDKHRIHIDMYRSKTGIYGVWLGFRAGSKYMPGQGQGEFDRYGQVKIGVVTIAPRDAKQ
jgi:lipoteichoic acid synthase